MIIDKQGLLCWIHFVAMLFDAYTYRILKVFCWIDFSITMKSFFISSNVYYLNVYIRVAIPAFI